MVGVLATSRAPMGTGMRRILVFAARVLVVVLPIVLWQILTDQRIMSAFILSQPTRVWARLQDWLADGTILSAATFTLTNTLVGFTLGVLLGNGLAILFTVYPKLGRVYLPFMTAINAVPRIAFAPLLVVAFGYGLGGAVGLIVLVITYFSFFTTYGGLQTIDPLHVAWARMQGATGARLWIHVQIPAILRWIVSSLRLSIGHAFSAAVVAEFLGVPKGLGALISKSINLFQADGLFAALATVAVMVFVIDMLIRAFERRFTGWAGA